MDTNKKKQSRKKKKRAKPRSTSTSNLPKGTVGGSMLTNTHTKSILQVVSSVYFPLDILHHQSNSTNAWIIPKSSPSSSNMLDYFLFWWWKTIVLLQFPTQLYLFFFNPFLLPTLTPAALLPKTDGLVDTQSPIWHLCPPWIVNKEFGNNQVIPENT